MDENLAILEADRSDPSMDILWENAVVSIYASL